MASSKLTARQAIAKVLKDSGKPMKVPVIIEKAVPLTNLGGATPGQTIYSVLYSENKKSGNARQFISTGRGTFKLNGSYKPVVRAAAAPKAAPAKAAPAKRAASKTTTSRKRATSRKRSSARVAA